MSDSSPGFALRIAVEGKPLEKLVDAVRKGCGVAYEPVHIVRMARAKAAAAAIRDNAEMERLRGTEQRKQYLGDRRQVNLEAITVLAAHHLPFNVDAEPVDEDWAVRFFDDCQDVSDEQLRELWARLLAGEVTRPGTVSKRTLSTVRDLSRYEAELFARAAALAWRRLEDGSAFIPSDEHCTPHLEEFDLELDCVLELDDIGLVRVGDSIGIRIPAEGTGIDEPYSAVFGGAKYHLKGRRSHHFLPATAFTRVGEELLRVCDSVENRAFLEESINRFQSRQIRVASDWPRNAYGPTEERAQPSTARPHR